MILNNNETTTLGDAYHRLKQGHNDINPNTGYLGAGKWGKKFQEIKDAEKWQRVDCEWIAKAFLTALLFAVVAALCFSMSLTGKQDGAAMLLFYFGSIDLLIVGMGFLAGFSMLIHNAIVSCKHKKIAPLLTHELSQEEVNQIVAEISMPSQ